VYSNSQITVREDRVLRPDGEQGSYTVALTRDAVYVVPITTDGSFVLVEQHRYPVDKMVLELAAGGLPAGIDRLVQAKAELLEETGARAPNVAVPRQLSPNDSTTKPRSTDRHGVRAADRA
jgi:hypothetical protein